MPLLRPAPRARAKGCPRRFDDGELWKFDIAEPEDGTTGLLSMRPEIFPRVHTGGQHFITGTRVGASPISRFHTLANNGEFQCICDSAMSRSMTFTARTPLARATKSKQKTRQRK